MKTKELKAERIRQGKNSTYMGKVIGKNDKTYRNKENGITQWTYEEARLVMVDLGLSLERADDIFLEYGFQIGKNADKN